MDAVKVTPMMQQYLQIKERYRDAILFFRLGDFYEMFFEDAHTASKILDITLTSRNRSEESSVPLCGVPYHSAEPYIQKLLEAGHKVAVCEQVEDPATAKGVVKREVVRVITPGTVTAAEALDARGNNFLAAVCKGQHGFGLALTDITTGEFRFTQVAEEAVLYSTSLGACSRASCCWRSVMANCASEFIKNIPRSISPSSPTTCSTDAARRRIQADRLGQQEICRRGCGRHRRLRLIWKQMPPIL